MGRLRYYLERLFTFGAGMSMALVFAIILVNSLRRYTIGKSVEWGDELPIYLMIYGVMFGLALAYLQDRHIRFTIATDFMNSRRQTQLFAFVDLCVVLIGGLLAWSGFQFASRRASIDSSGLIGSAKSLVETTGIDAFIWIGRVSTYQFSITIGGILLALAAIVKFAERRASLAGEA